MKSLKYYGNKDLRIEEVSEPSKPQAGYVKVEVEYCGICGSDLHEYVGGPIAAKPPVTLGHEFTGKIVEIGENVPEFINVGQRIAGLGAEVCLQCPYCLKGEYNRCLNLKLLGFEGNGGFAKYVNIPWVCSVSLPENVSYEHGALCDPYGTAMHGLKRASMEQGDTIAIFGLGPIGLAILDSALAAGAKQVIAIDQEGKRLDAARKLGAHVVLDYTKVNVVEEILKFTGGIGVDIAADCAGTNTSINQAIASTCKGGTALVVAIFEKPPVLNFVELTLKEINLIFTFGICGEANTALSMMSDGRLHPEYLITKKIKLDKVIEEGFEELVKHNDRNIKILVSMEE